MTIDHRYAAACAALLCIASAAEAKDKPPAASPAEARCAVWQREASFADAVLRHDTKAFAAHLAKGAVFINGQPPHLHGEAEVLEGWSGIIAGEGLILRWHPEFVAIAGDGRTALSRGPFTMENPSVNPEARFRIGVFQSVWTLGEDGQWSIAFDGGGPPPKPANEAEVRAMQSSWKQECPFR